MIELAFAVVDAVPWGCVTRFRDGAEIAAWPHPELPHYHVVAHRCGYGDDLLAYCREHEVCHLIVEERLHGRASRVLWGLAHLDPVTAAEAIYEEIAAQALQRFLRAAERPIIGGADWDDLRTFALAALGDHPWGG